MVAGLCSCLLVFIRQMEHCVPCRLAWRRAAARLCFQASWEHHLVDRPDVAAEGCNECALQAVPQLDCSMK